MRLFCFPCAGGTADFFHQLDPWLGPSVELTGLEYAGHGARHKEPLYQDFNQLAEDLYAAVKRLYRPVRGGRPERGLRAGNQGL